MGKFVIYVGRIGYEISGTEAAFNTYSKAVEFAEALGVEAMILSADTGEVIAATDIEYDIRDTYSENE